MQAGGNEAMIARLKDPAIRKRVIAEMKDPNAGWENIRLLTGSDDRVLVIDFKNEKLKPLLGKTLAQIAKLRGTSPEETLIDLVIEDEGRASAAYFLMSEDNVELGLKQPWVSLGSDAESSAPEGVFLKSSSHPRAYGNFARFLGHYVRDRHLMPLQEGVHRLTGLPAQQLETARPRLPGAGLLRRHRRVRPGDHRRSLDLRQAPAVRHRRQRRVRQRRAGAARRRAHRRETGSCRARPRLDAGVGYDLGKVIRPHRVPDAPKPIFDISRQVDISLIRIKYS